MEREQWINGESGKSLKSHTVSALWPVSSASVIRGISESPGILARNADSLVSSIENSESAGLRMRSMVWKVGLGAGRGLG